MIDTASVQYNAKISSDIPFDKKLITDGTLIAVFQIQNM